MSLPFADEVRLAFSGAEATRDLDVIDVQESSSFDNARAELHGGPIRLCVIRERGQIYLDLGAQAEPSRWFQFYHVLRAIGAAADAEALVAGGQTSLESLAQLFDKQFAALRIAFDTARYAETQRAVELSMSALENSRWGGGR